MPGLPHRRSLATIMAMLPFAAANAGPDPLMPYRWSHRVVVALAPSASDLNLSAQRRIFETMRAGARERDLVLLEAPDDTPDGTVLRRRFGGGTGFRVVLIGKDGGEKAASGRPFEPSELFATIDAMPMRRAEMLRQTP